MIGYVIGFLVFLLLVLASCVKIVPQAQAFILERLGAYQATWSVGIHFKIPFIFRQLILFYRWGMKKLSKTLRSD